MKVEQGSIYQDPGSPFDGWRLVTEVEQAEELLRVAYDAGLDEDYVDLDGKVEWDRLLQFLEMAHQVLLPEEYDDPVIKAIKSAYRRGKKEAV